ncbi:dihydromonapterin reductase [Alteromonas sp. 5E99-2]|uniref:dihydromonapterin reductase n=1 Tax=Alteromonas sp. 5E99-2 TaxID=2817683 RepID=UPI00325C21C1
MLNNTLTHPILITGGTQRLGLAIAEDLIKQNQSVIITYRTHKPAVEYLSTLGAHLIHTDFEEESSVANLLSQVKKRAPKLKAIIHNASDWDAELSDESDIDTLNKMMKIHVSVPYQLNWALKENLFQTSGFADIIHMTDYVQDTGSAKYIAYSASKAALHNLTLSFAKKLAPKVKVNSIAPALVMFNDEDTENYRIESSKKSLLQQVPGPQEAVKAVNYLLDSNYITGQTLHLNGGRHLK